MVSCPAWSSSFLSPRLASLFPGEHTVLSQCISSFGLTLSPGVFFGQKMVRDFPHGAVGRNLPTDAGDTGSTSGWKGSRAAEQLSRRRTAPDGLTPRLCNQVPPRSEALACTTVERAPASSAQKARTRQGRPGLARSLFKLATTTKKTEVVQQQQSRCWQLQTARL